ncbi:hypothetical protein PsYK624_172200 [Phanerochaete sordida]|uniref:Uncharacterized protein n=1 Tax=Phanerochaete sordida TaxID=48140 RepID=A0A9P3LN24_9APHY|nr:hypothetical protein PsYK624_172200 [Phanerochaete sordida]
MTPLLARSDRQNHALAEDQEACGPRRMPSFAAQADLSHRVLAAPSRFLAKLGGFAVGWRDFGEFSLCFGRPRDLTRLNQPPPPPPLPNDSQGAPQERHRGSRARALNAVQRDSFAAERRPSRGPRQRRGLCNSRQRDDDDQGADSLSGRLAGLNSRLSD